MALPGGFDYLPDWLGRGRADALFETLWREIAWQQQDIFLFGRAVRQPRLTAWCSDPGVRYRYSGLCLEPTPWHPDLTDLRSRLARDLGVYFNSVLLNAYRNGRDSMGWHADNEPELGPQPRIASVSLGAVRRMLVRPASGGASVGQDLEPGSLLVMSERSQDDWRHAIPKVRKPVGPRINLTFRLID